MWGLVMGAAGTLLEKIIGPWAKTLAIPAMIAAVTLGVHTFFEQHDAKVTKLCDANWEAKIRGEEQVKADQRVGAVNSILESERQTTTGLKDDLSKLHAQMDALRATASADPKCLSDGVLQSLGSAKEQ